MTKLIETIQIEVKTSFDSYKTKRKDNTAIKHIRKWIVDSIKGSCPIPLYIEKDSNGSFIEEMTETTIKFIN